MKAQLFSRLGLTLRTRTKIILTAVLGLVIFSVVMVFPWRYPIELLLRWGPSETAVGRVVRYEPSWFNGGQRRDGSVLRINRVYVQFKSQSGREVTTYNYFPGLRQEWGFNDNGAATGQTLVRVSYHPHFQSWALFSGGSLSPYGPEFMLFAIMPVIIFIFVWLWRTGLKTVSRLLDEGVAAEAEVLEVTISPRTRPRRIKYAVRLGFEAGSGRAEAVHDAYAKDEGRRLLRMRDMGLKVHILYLPSDPETIFVLGREPGLLNIPSNWFSVHDRQK